MDERYVIPSLDRAFSVLELLGHASRGLSLAELVRQSDIPKSTLFRILITLQKRHCVVWDEENRSYRLGSMLWSLGSSFLSQSDIYRMAAVHMKDLAEKTRETIFLGEMEGDEVVYLRRMESPRSVTVVKKLGQRVPMHCTATGMAMLAFMAQEQIDSLLERTTLTAFNESTITDRQVLLERLSQIKRDGYALVDGEFNEELLCISAPVFDHTHQPRASLTVAMLSNQAPDHQKKRTLANDVMEASRNFSRELGYIQPTNLLID